MSTVSLDRSEWVDIGLLVVGGLVLGAGTFVFRAQVPPLPYPESVFLLQYVLGFLFIGVAVLLIRYSNTVPGTIGNTMLLFAMLVGATFPPQAIGLLGIVSNVLYLTLVVVGGLLYYRHADPSNVLLIGAATVLSHEFFLYAVGIGVSAYQKTGNTLVLASVVPAIMVLWGYRRVLKRELRKINVRSTSAEILQRFLLVNR